MVLTSNQGFITHINLDININRIYVAWPMVAILNSKMFVTPIILSLHSMDCLTLKYMIITSNQADGGYLEFQDG